MIFVFMICLNKLEDCFDVFGDLVKLHICFIFILSLEEYFLFNFNNIIIRSCGISWDLRADCIYYFAFLILYFTLCGDSFDRLLIRFSEIKESFLLYFLFNFLLIKFYHINILTNNFCFKWLIFSSMEFLINIFFFNIGFLYSWNKY